MRGTPKYLTGREPKGRHTFSAILSLVNCDKPAKKRADLDLFAESPEVLEKTIKTLAEKRNRMWITLRKEHKIICKTYVSQLYLSTPRMEFKQILRANYIQHSGEVFHAENKEEGGHGVALSQTSFRHKNIKRTTIHQQSITCTRDAHHNDLNEMGGKFKATSIS